MAIPPPRPALLMAELACLESLVGSVVSHTRTWCRAGSLGRGFPFNGNWRLNISDDFDFSRHESEDVILVRRNWHELDDWRSALGYDDGLARRLNPFHDGETARLEGAGWYLLHL